MQKVSVITMTYNDCAHLKSCVEQVVRQDYENLEYIIVDGGSTDGSLDVIRETEKQLGKHLKWVSEPDNGLYDALNKGIKMATGDIIGLMCDRFADEHVISEIVETMERENADGVHGDVDYMENGRTVRCWRMGEGTLNEGWMPAHPTLYLKKEVYRKYGFYKTDYKIAADYEYMVRILKDGSVKLAYIPRVLVQMNHGENSTSTGGPDTYILSFMEGRRALRENHMPHPLYTCILRTFRVIRQFADAK